MALPSQCAKLRIHLVRVSPSELSWLIDAKLMQIFRTGGSYVRKVCQFHEVASSDSTRVHGGLNLVEVNIVPRLRTQGGP